MNLNKYTKAELISKIQNTKPKLEIQNSSSITEKIISKILLFKSLILKITLIAFIIKWFKKYSLIRKLWMIINTTVMSLFGISLIDVYGFDILSYFRDNSIYTWFSGLLSTPKINKPHESIPSFMRETNKNATGNEKGSRVIERFKQIIHPEPEVIQESSNTKYYIMGALFIISCLTWYYYGDNITPVIGNGIDKIKSSFRRKPDSDGSATTNITQNSSENLSNNSWNDTLWNIWSKIKSKFIRNNQPPSDPNSLTPNTPAQIELINKSTKYPDLDNAQLIASSSKLSPIAEVSEKSTPSSGWIGENAMEQYFKDDSLDKGKGIDMTNLTEAEITRRLIEQSTGSSLAKFEIESEELINKMSHFVSTHENGAFPNIDIKKGICSLLSTQMTVLYLNYKNYYSTWLIKPENSEIYSKFKNIEQEIKTLDVNETQQSNNYEEVANFTTQEQEAWSDDANSSVHSPYVKEEQFDNKSMLGPFLDELDKLPTPPGIIEQVEAEVAAESQQTVEPPKSGINALWDQIKARRNDTNVIDDTNKEAIVSSNSSEDGGSESSSSESTNALEHYLPESQTQQNNLTNPEIKYQISRSRWCNYRGSNAGSYISRINSKLS